MGGVCVAISPHPDPPPEYRGRGSEFEDRGRLFRLIRPLPTDFVNDHAARVVARGGHETAHRVAPGFERI